MAVVYDDSQLGHSISLSVAYIYRTEVAQHRRLLQRVCVVPVALVKTVFDNPPLCCVGIVCETVLSLGQLDPGKCAFILQNSI